MKLSRCYLALCLTLGSSAGKAWAQEPADPQGPQTATPATKAKKRDRRVSKELGSAYDSWLRDEVPDIITAEERRAFSELSTNEEREQFIEGFWNRRNPDPESGVNATREEHYRRLAYADEHFVSGVPGRKTDRGRIYIIWGPPDEIDAHPAGGSYDRPLEQGGGSSTAYAWEVWRYRHLDELGENVELEFVDPSGSGEYHITNDPCEKDALAHVPGAGPSLSEMMGQSRAGRFSNSNGTSCPAALGGLTTNANEFDRLDLFFRVQRPPEHLKELAEKVSSRIVANQLRFQYRVDFLRAAGSTALVPITLELRNRDLSYQNKQGVESAVLEVYGRVTDVGGRIVQTFEDMISRDFPEALFHESISRYSIYQKTLPLRAGLYRLDLVLKDTQSGNLAIVGEAIRVPRFDEDKMDASSLILADQIEPVPSKQIGGGQFVLDSYRVRPRISRELGALDRLGIFLQLYNLKLGPDTHKTEVGVTYRVLKDQREVWREVETPEHLSQGREQLTIQRFIPVSELSPGRYTIEVIAIDLLTKETVIRSADFTIEGAAPANPSSKAPTF